MVALGEYEFYTGYFLLTKTKYSLLAILSEILLVKFDS